MTSSFSGTDIFWSGSDTWVMWVGSLETARGQGQPGSALAETFNDLQCRPAARRVRQQPA
jgi:hypothetical protein